MNTACAHSAVKLSVPDGALMREVLLVFLAETKSGRRPNTYTPMATPGTLELYCTST